jgi:hypothetical protein
MLDKVGDAGLRLGLVSGASPDEEADGHRARLRHVGSNQAQAVIQCGLLIQII